MESELETAISTNNKIGAVLVVGAGVSGIQAALDLAGSGFKVYLVDKAASIGGKMAQLDKTFPTNDCSMCILSPKFIECARNPNIDIITNTEVSKLEGEMGNFTVTLLQKPRYVNEELCRGCPTCVEYCPVKISDAYNVNLSTTRCISIPFAQAVPAVPLIDPDHCLFFLRRECQICRPVCKNKAIDFRQTDKELKIAVGSIILAPGYETFEPRWQSEYGYGRLSNVITSLEFERILSASGPYHGEVARPSDKTSPRRIAWIQCVGSRDTTANHTYCSAVCCMYAIKQVILAKDHEAELEATVFHNDIRAYGKGFERYYDRAKSLPGVRFIWSKVSILRESAETKKVLLRYRNNGTKTTEEEFDLVVLSVGLAPREDVKQLAARLSIELNASGFCQNPEFAPVATSRPGIYACGVFHAPMDIPDSVTMASSAASQAAQILSSQRGTLVKEKEYPLEQDVSREPARVGVFVCHCGTNIARVVDIAKVVQTAQKLDGVIHAEHAMFMCSIDSVSHIVATVREKGINRLVVAACTPRTHEPVFQEALREAGLNPYLFEMANIREQCSWVHARDKAIATEKAQDLVRMAVARVKLLKPLFQIPYAINNAALVIGGGVAGMVSALTLAQQGFEVHLLEKERELGGISRRIFHTLDGGDIQAYVTELIARTQNNPLIHIYTRASITWFGGYVGNFTTRIAMEGETAVREIAHGAVVVATGAEEYQPGEFLYGDDRRVVTLLELEAEIARHSDRIARCKSLVIIHCVGSRDTEHPYCSRVCCSLSIKNALKLKTMNPDMEIYVLYRDMRTYGLSEDYYCKAAEQDIKFIRYEVDDKPEVTIVQEGDRSILRVTVTDSTLGQRLMLDADILALGAATVPAASNKELSQLLKVPLNQDGFFMEAHMKLRPVDFATDGIFMAGLAHNPKSIDESIAQAQAAACRAAAILSRDTLASGGIVCTVNEDQCSGCGICQSLCPFQAIEMQSRGDKRISHINEALCKGCGTCCAACPSLAIIAHHFTDEEIRAQIEAALVH